MRALDRLIAVFKVGLGTALAPAADPRVAYVTDEQKHRALLAQVAAAMGEVSASKERLRDKTNEVRSRLPAMLDVARDELVAGRPDLARMSLQRRQVALLELQTLETQVAEIEKEEGGLLMLERRLGTQIEAFAARQEMILARYSAAEAQVRINEAVTGVSQQFAELTAALQRAEEKTEGMEARATAIDRLVRERVLEASSFTSPADPVEAGGQDVELELAALETEVADRRT